MITNIALTAGVTPLGALYGNQSTGQLVRTSTGVLYVVTPYVVNGPTSIFVFKSTDNGKTWALKDYHDSPVPVASGAPVVTAVSAAIDSNDIIHIGFLTINKASKNPGHITFSTATDTFGSRLDNINSASSAYNSIAIAVDSNNAVHMVIAGGTTGNVQYTNNVAGYFIPIVTIASSSTATNVDIQFKNNIPVISFYDPTAPAYNLLIGNKNNPTSFTTNTSSVPSTVASAGGTSIAVDSNNNVWAAFTTRDGRVNIIENLATSAWSAWQTPINDGNNGVAVSLAVDGTNIYVFYEQALGGLAYDRYDSVNGKWLGEQVIVANTSKSTTNKRYHHPFVKWSNYFDNGFTGSNNQNQNLIEYLFDDGNTVYYGSLDVAQIATGLASIKFMVPQGATTTSTSTSISTSSTSSSTSTTTSSTSSSTSTTQSTSTSSTSTSTTQSTSTSITTSSTSSSTSTTQSTSTSITTSSTSSSTSTTQSTSTSQSSTSSSTSTTQSTSTSITTSSTSTSTTQSTSTSITTSSTSSSTSVSTSTSITTSSTSSSTSTTQSTSTSITTSSTSSSTSTTQSTSTSITTSSTSSSTSTTQSTSTSITTSSTSSSTSTTQSTSTSQSSTSSSTSTTHSTSTSITTSSTSSSTSVSTSTSITTSSTSSSTSTTQSTSTSITTSSTSSSTSQSTSTSITTSSTSSSTSTTQSTSTSITTSSTSSSTSTTVSFTTSTSSTSTSISTTTSQSTSTSSTSTSTTQSTSTSITTSSTSTSLTTSTSHSTSSTSTSISTTTSVSTSTSMSSTSTSTTVPPTPDLGYIPRVDVYPKPPRVGTQYNKRPSTVKPYRQRSKAQQIRHRDGVQNNKPIPRIRRPR